MNSPNAALSSAEIQAFLTNQFHEMGDFVTDLDRIRDSGYSYDSVFGPDRHSRIIYLKNTGTEIGHFTLLSDLGDHFEWFDSTAGELPEVLAEFCRRNKPNSYVAGVKERLQSKDSYICGKWCIMRYMSLPTTLSDFIEIFTASKSKLTPDSVVDRLIQIKLL